MANSGHLIFVLSLCVGLTILFPFGCNAQSLFIFGDGNYDTGNTLYISSDNKVPSHYPPYGMTFFGHPTGRFSDGRLISDFIASVDMNLHTFIEPALNSEADFSHGATLAVYGAKVVGTDNTNTLDFIYQAQKYSQVVINATQARSAVYLISIGANDYYSFLRQYPHATEAQIQEFVDLVIAQTKNIVRTIYAVSGRKFLFQNMGPIGCFPAIKQSYDITDGSCAGVPSTLALLHNEALSKLAEELKTQLFGFSYSIFDYHKAITSIIENPSVYQSVDVACCGKGTHRGYNCGGDDGDYEVCSDPSTYVFFDGLHHTERINERLAQDIWYGSTNIIAPYNLQQLLAIVPPEPRNKISPRKFGYLSAKKLRLQASYQ